jgi:hypothetical protein
MGAVLMVSCRLRLGLEQLLCVPALPRQGPCGAAPPLVACGLHCHLLCSSVSWGSSGDWGLCSAGPALPGLEDPC